MKDSLPKILIISRGVWDDSQGTSSTLTNLFEDYDPEKLAHIYIETKQPHTHCCYRFFQISEFSLIQKLLRWRLKTGHAFDTRLEADNDMSALVAEHEAAIIGFVRAHRSIIYSMLREVLWGFNGWRSKELSRFVCDFNPDVIWIDGSPLPLMNRIYDYVLKNVRKPASIFLQDDIYTYQSCAGGLLYRMRRFRLRNIVRRVITQCSNVFVASPKMKREYDEIFGVNSTFIAKSFRLEGEQFQPVTPHKPIRLVYMGQIIYGRIKTLIDIAECMTKVNEKETKLQMYIYTNNQISAEDSHRLLAGGHVFLKEPVPYSEVPAIIAVNDVVVFVETFDPKLNKISRLSFSTKISDYLRSGKCVLAIGPADVAPIEYFKEEDAAIVATHKEEIANCLVKIINSETIKAYSAKAFTCAARNHERNKMNETIYGKLVELSGKRI